MKRFSRGGKRRTFRRLARKQRLRSKRINTYRLARGGIRL